MTNETIAMVVGVIFSVAFDFVPKLKDWYGKLQDGQKRLVAVGLGLLVVGVTLGLSCFQMFSVNQFTCDQKGIEEALRVWGLYVFANQTTYALATKPLRKKLS